MIIATAIFLISAAALGLELVLVRAFSIGHWHHFSYLVISTALLGFAAGGTFVTIGSKFLTKNHNKSLWFLTLGLALAVPFVFNLSQKVPFDQLQLIWDSRQVLYLFAYYLLFFVPFFCAGSAIALAFTVLADKAHRLYFYNMSGSGLGVAAIVALMYGNSPETLLLAVSFIAFVAAMVLAFAVSLRRLVITLVCGAAWLLAFSSAGPFPLRINISENKSLVYYSALPQAETIAVRYSPLARLDCIQAPTIRYFPGLSLAYQGSLAVQKLIISDADGISAVNHFESLDDLDCFDHTTSALAYHLIEKPYVCIIGAGGGTDVAQALAGGATKLVAVEMNRQIVDLLRGQFNEFACGLYRRNDVRVVIAEGRSFLRTTPERFDIISISLLDSFTASAAGVYALNESHLYTVEAIAQALAKLRPNGLLSVTRVLKTPPRDNLKMLATVAEALRRQGITNPAENLIMIRSWATATILVSPQPFSKPQIANARQFARRRGFDLVHLPDINPQEANHFHKLQQPIYYESAVKILSPDYENFYRDYAYNIRPATDDKPYFFDFFKWKSLPHMIRTMGRQWLPFAEWGHLILAATLLQALAASTVFILLPVFIAKPIKTVRSAKLPTLIYFLSIGLAYMFLEMGFIQKLTLLIGHPVFGVAATLLGFLFFSACGAMLSSRWHHSAVRQIRIATSAIVIVAIAEIVLMMLSFDWLVGFSRPARILLSLALTAPLAFAMGVPFPSALKLLNIANTPLVPWAWAVNGFASVTAAVLGTFLAVSVGFTTLTLTALLCYILAAMVSTRICPQA